MVSPWMFSDKEKSMDLMTHSNSNMTVTDIQHRPGGKNLFKIGYFGEKCRIYCTIAAPFPSKLLFTL